MFEWPRRLTCAAGGRDVLPTRLACAVEGRVLRLVEHLAGRFESAGLACELRQRETPRGRSTAVALAGPRGLLCMADIIVIECLTRAGEPGARLDIRLPDACGDPVAHGSTGAADDILAPAQIGPRAKALHRLVMGVFRTADARIRRPVAPAGARPGRCVAARCGHGRRSTVVALEPGRPDRPTIPPEFPS